MCIFLDVERRMERRLALQELPGTAGPELPGMGPGLPGMGPGLPGMPGMAGDDNPKPDLDCSSAKFVQGLGEKGRKERIGPP